jgi:NAD(P)-dependent dehydrogenase (short-subunit alcohol dehydrogenase family)
VSRVALVTGAASGIGLALARALAARGDRVILTDVDEAGLDRAAGLARAAGAAGRVEAATLDVRDAAAVDEAVAAAFRRHRRLDLMVNNAGIGVGGEVTELSVAHWDRVIDVNLRGVVHGVQAAYPRMVAQGSGHLVNLASLAGLVPAPLLVPYAATKHAVVGLSLSLRAEAAAHGVRVTAVCPGFVDTPILDKAGPADLPAPALATRTRELALRYARRLAAPDAVAADVLAGIDRDRPLVVTPARARLAWRLQRLAPGLLERGNRRVVAAIRREVAAGA